MDAAYLQSSVGEPLKAALTSLVVVQPPDAIEYIGNYLLEHVKKVEGEAARKARFDFLDEAVAAQDAALAEAAAAEEARLKALGPTDDEVALDASLLEDDDVEALYDRALAACARASGARACYVGAKGATAAGRPVVAFSHATPGCGMAATCLFGATPETEEADEGLALDLFKQREEYEAELAAADEALAAAQANSDAALAGGDDAPDPAAAAAELDAAAAAKAGLARYPARVAVPNVAREPRVKFFGVPLLGSYCAVAVRYRSGLHADGVGGPLPEPEPAAEEAAAAEGANAPEEPAPAAEGDEAPPAAEGDDAPPADGAEPAEPAEPEAPPPRAPKAQAVLLPVEKVLCVHTMGSSKVLAEADMAAVAAWAAKLAGAHERADAARWAASAILREDALEAQGALKTAATTAEAEEETKMEELLTALEADPPADADKPVEVAKLRVASMMNLVRIYFQTLEKMAQDRIPPPAAGVVVLQAALAPLGLAPAAFAALGTGLPEWPKIAAALGDKFVPAIMAEAGVDFAAAVKADADGSAPLPVDLAALKATIDELDLASLGAYYGGDLLLRLVQWLKSLFALWDVVKAQVQAAADAAAAEAEAA